MKSRKNTNKTLDNAKIMEQVKIEVPHYNDGPEIPLTENPHFFALIRFLSLLNETNLSIKWTFTDIEEAFQSNEPTDYCKNLHLKLLGLLGKRFPPNVTLERNLTKFIDERVIDIEFMFWDKIESMNKELNYKEEKEEKEENDVNSMKLNYNPYRNLEYKDVALYERLRTIRILINCCIQESKQVRNAIQSLENYNKKCQKPIAGCCFFGISSFLGNDELGYHYWYITSVDDDTTFKLYREDPQNGNVILLSDNSDTLCTTYRSFLEDNQLEEIGKILENKYQIVISAEKAKLRRIRQMKSIRNQLESSWGNCAPTEAMLTGGRTRRKATLNIDYSFSKYKGQYEDETNGNLVNSYSNRNPIDRSDRLALRNAKKERFEEQENENQYEDEQKQKYNEQKINIQLKQDLNNQQLDNKNIQDKVTHMYSPQIEDIKLPNKLVNEIPINHQISNNILRNSNTISGLNIFPTNIGQISNSNNDHMNMIIQTRQFVPVINTNQYQIPISSFIQQSNNIDKWNLNQSQGTTNIDFNCLLQNIDSQKQQQIVSNLYNHNKSLM
ncbi:uncharacterized protein CMU_006270 [Cryptosporidium muris RN66]|uniref:DDT domain-containing protein n=1 Tax=Cryptosporidium muris (strain RN66) TaxID=441375 RepID=B6AHK9_CRYMR|nr:uncharacterized protein CMU_006270 [Cryptosporidium muris RN66]EEA07704.1 hypothetical protein, conserved [Cryptosporidium muris RN66]|eukprot:XP_002142053.1 hypothetical protein [Cryptosporidium muris RN66]